jgi:hypothetical protein
LDGFVPQRVTRAVGKQNDGVHKTLLANN